MLGQWLGRSIGQWFGATTGTPATQAPLGGGGWKWDAGYERELARLLRRRLRRDEDEERIEAALEAVGAAPKPPPAKVAQDDTARLRALVARYERLQLPPSKRTQRAVDYARRAQTQLAYELALREIAQQIEDDEISLMVALASIA